MIHFNVQSIFRARGITRPNAFLVNAGMSRQAAAKLLYGDPRLLRFDHLEFLCHVLRCEPNDLFTWTPGNGINPSPDHPLYKLKNSEPPADWQKTIENLSYKEIKEVARYISESKKKEG